jgi:ligand-binding sensor domain-containing protein
MSNKKPMKKRGLLRTPLYCLVLVSCLSAGAWCGQLEIIDHRTEEEGLFSNIVTAVSPAGDTGVFIASAGGLHVLSDYFFLPIFQKIPAVALSQDPGGDLWAATGAGFIYRVTDRDGVWTASRFAVDKGKKITAIAARFGAVTIGTDSGLYRADPDGTLTAIVNDVNVSALAVAEDGTIIAGARDRSHRKGGLLIIRATLAGKNGWVDDFSGGTVRVLFVDGDRVLVGTEAGVAFILEGTGIRNIALPEKPSTITAILVYDGITLIASDTALYAAEKDGPFETVSGDGAPSGITSLAPAPGKTLWIGTRADGIYLVRVRP